LVEYSKFINVLEKVWNTKLNITLSSKVAENVLGETSRYTIRSNTKATIEKLMLNGFNFRLDDLEMALRHTLGKITKVDEHF
jgi:NAD dependent epimerase/dehydratase family enzyme